MFRQFLVVFVFQNGVFSLHNDNDLPTSTLIKLISRVIENDNNNHIRYETIEDRGPIDLEYYDFNSNSYNKKEVEDISSDLLREEEEDDPRTKEVRIHFIQNPEVLQQYQNLLYDKRHSSDSKPKFHAKIYKSLTLEDIISHLRRNAAFRLDTVSSENKLKGEEINNDKTQQQSQKLNLDKKKDKFDDDIYEQKPRKDDWDTSVKNNKDKNKKENRSKERSGNIDKEWSSKKTNDNFKTEKKINPNWDDEYQTNDRNSRSKDIKESNYRSFDIISDTIKDSNRKPAKSIGLYKNFNYKPLKTDNYKETNYNRKESNFKPMRLSEHFKPNYKPFPSDSERKPDRKDDYNEFKSNKLAFKDGYKEFKNIKPAYIEPKKPAYKEIINYAPRIKNSVERRPREKKIDRNGGGSFGRTPIPYVGHRGIYDDEN